MKRLLSLLLIESAAAFAQSPQRNSYGPVSQGAVIAIPNTAGSQAVSFEYLFSATPGATSITIQGCMRGSNPNPGAVGTCDAAADTYAGTSNSVRSPGFTKVYDTFLITVTTLTNATLTVNTTVVVSKVGTSSGGGSGGGITNSAGANVITKSDGTNLVASSLSDNGTTLSGTEPLSIAQGTITVSTPVISHTVTWNAAGVAFTNWLSNITCTAAATASIAAGFGTAGTQWQFKYAAANCASPQLLMPSGSSTAPAIAFSSTTNSGLSRGTNSSGPLLTVSGTDIMDIHSTGARIVSTGVWGITPGAPDAANADTGWSRTGADAIAFGNGTQGDSSATVTFKAQASNTNCSATGTAANPSVASCGSAMAGSFSCATNASAGTCVVNTTAVTANSEIFITQRADTTTGTRLSVTCNTTVSTVLPIITAVTAATSFTINLGTITTNPECFSYFIVN